MSARELMQKRPRLNTEQKARIALNDLAEQGNAKWQTREFSKQGGRPSRRLFLK